jgi:hypothetical protein
MTAGNKMQDIIGHIVDYDAVSLYPSAMSIMYFPSGVPKTLTEE